MSEENRRISPRRFVYMGAEIESEEGKLRNALTRDASVTGLMLLTRAQLAIGSHVQLRVFAPHDDSRSWHLGATVVRKEPLDASESSLWKEKVAVQFDSPQPELVDYVQGLADVQDQLYGRR